jgi:hypothetical protein
LKINDTNLARIVEDSVLVKVGRIAESCRARDIDPRFGRPRRRSPLHGVKSRSFQADLEFTSYVLPFKIFAGSPELCRCHRE